MNVLALVKHARRSMLLVMRRSLELSQFHLPSVSTISLIVLFKLYIKAKRGEFPMFAQKNLRPSQTKVLPQFCFIRITLLPHNSWMVQAAEEVKSILCPHLQMFGKRELFKGHNVHLPVFLFQKIRSLLVTYFLMSNLCVNKVIRWSRLYPIMLW